VRESVDLIVDYLIAHGFVDAGMMTLVTMFLNLKSALHLAVIGITTLAIWKIDI